MKLSSGIVDFAFGDADNDGFDDLVDGGDEFASAFASAKKAGLFLL